MYSDDDIECIVIALQVGMYEKREHVLTRFAAAVRKNLHVITCLSVPGVLTHAHTHSEYI